MTILQGTMQDGTVIPVQVDAQGRLVAEVQGGDPVRRTGDTMTGPLSIHLSSNATAIDIAGVNARQVMHATGGVNSPALTQYQTSGATYFVGTSDGYLNDVFYIASSAIAGQAGSQLGFTMFPNGVTHMATANTNLAGGPFVRIGPAVTANGAGLARLNVESRDLGGTGFLCQWYNNSPAEIGSITVNGLGVNYNNTSDRRLKENIQTLTGSVNVVKNLKPVSFDWIDENGSTIGFIADEVQAVVPEAVTGQPNETRGDGDGKKVPVYQQLNTTTLIPHLTAALQEALAKIETLETKVAALEVKP